MYRTALRYRLFIFIMFVTIAACGGGGGASSQPAQPVDIVKAKSVADALKMMDQNGDAPQLNRDSTVAGPDADANGVRDDIDAYIGSLPDTAPQKAALRQCSAALRNTMLADMTDQSVKIDAARKIANSVACVFSRYGAATGAKRVYEMEKFTVNTKVRYLAYEKYNAAVSGTSTVIPVGGGCEN